MFNNLFDASEAQAFGKSLAETFSVKYPAIDMKKETSSMNKRAKVLGKLIVEAREFGQAHRLNLYKKAKLGNAFKWVLLEKGYDREFVNDLTKEVILALK